MEEKIMRQKTFPSEYLDDMLLASFLNDEYEELQEDVQENIFGLHEGVKGNECLPENNACDIQKKVKRNLSSEVLTSTNINNNKQMLETQLNVGDSILKKRNMEVLEIKQNNSKASVLLQKMQESDKNSTSVEETVNNKIYDSHCLKVNTEDSGLTRRKTGILNEKIFNSNEIISNGSILQNGPNNIAANAEIPTIQDDKIQLQLDYTTCIGEDSYVTCRDNFLLILKICFIILLFSSLLYYFLIQKR